MEEAVSLTVEGHVATLTLDRPAQRNSMTAELLDAFAAKVAAVRRAPDVRAVIVTGRGACFSAGADFRAMVQRPLPGRLPHERSYAMYEPFLSVLDIEVPVIAAVQGHAVGGGFGLALACDLRIVANEARVGASFTRLGIHPGLATTFFLPRLVGSERAAELLYTGRLVEGAEAARFGLALEACPVGDVISRANALAAAIAAAAPLAVRTTKRALRAELANEARRAAYEEALVQAHTLGTADAEEGISALLDKRPPSFTGA